MPPPVSTPTLDATELARILHERSALFHASMRRWQVCLQASVVFGSLALLPLIPGARRLVQVTWHETVGWVGLLIATTWIAFALYQRLGFDSRAYRAVDRLESTVYSWVPAMLVAEGGSPASFWWIVYFALSVTMALQGASGWYEPALAGLAPVVAGVLLWHGGAGVVALVECLGIAAVELILYGLLAAQADRAAALEAERNLLRQRVVDLERDRERHRIAGELHDGLGGELTAIALMGQTGATRYPAAAGAFRDIVARAQEGIAEIRAAVWSSRSEGEPWADQLAHLRQAGDRLCDPAGVTFVLASEGEVRLTVAGRHQLLRVLQELVHNALRHARPGRIEARVVAAGDTVTLTVRDDGPGIPSGALAAGRGLAGLTRRATALGGSFEITGDGAARLTFPVQSAARVA